MTKISSLDSPSQLQRVKSQAHRRRSENKAGEGARVLQRPAWPQGTPSVAGISHQAERELEEWSWGRTHAAGLVLTRPCGFAFLFGTRA